MKKLLFSAYDLNLGGIETALVTLLNYLVKRGYYVTLALEKKEGIFLTSLDKRIEVIEYRPRTTGNVIIRKLSNLLKRIFFKIKYGNQYDFAASFATYSLAGSYMARTASKNSALWGHADYFTLFDENEKEMIQFFRERKCNQFQHIVFVSEEGRKSFIRLFPNLAQKTITCNNLIDAKRIKQKAKEKISLKKEKDITTFLNVGRQEERQKKLTRLINAAKQLKQDNEKFRILMVGEGPDTEKYKSLVIDMGLEDNIIFEGRQQNPYPYFAISDCTVLTSDYEGYPVVFLESMVLGVPIITTKVSDYETIEGKYGLITEKEEKSIYKAMKQMIHAPYRIPKTFDEEQYNQEIIEKLEKIW